MEILEVNGEPAVRIKAEYLTCSGKAVKYNCEGDHVWIPRSVHKREPVGMSILIMEWWYNKNFE